MPTDKLHDADLRATLKLHSGPCEFSDLRPHLVRDVVFEACSSLDLLDAAEALARDDVAQVKVWTDAGMLRRPGTEVAERWQRPSVSLEAVVVRPWVLVQETPA